MKSQLLALPRLALPLLARPLLALPLLALPLLALSLQLSAPAMAAKPPETIDPAASCVGECHAPVTQRPFLHWKNFAGAGECQECHVPEDDQHVFELADEPDLCLACHEDIETLLDEADTIHPPAEEECLECHDPHGARVEKLLLRAEDEDLRPLCYECHDAEDVLPDEHKHGPVAQGECIQCHNPHGSANEFMLLGEDPDLCLDCHVELAEEIDEAEVVHPPAEDACLDCHRPHSAKEDKLLIASKRKLCNECHDDIVELAEGARVDHEPVLTGKECLECHAPHVAAAEPNLRKPQPDLCLDCHSERVDSGGRELANIGKQLAGSENWHEPIRKKGCSACHSPHGSENFRMLEKSFPETFYTAFDTKQYALCFSCHKSAALARPRTRSSTNFRDGDLNLHYLHVNREKRGRTCRACHEMHATPEPKQIREKVQYGKWLMPLRYEQTESGGSCHPGCHDRLEYDRDAPNRPRK